MYENHVDIQLFELIDIRSVATEISQTTLALSEVAMRMSQVKRVPRYDEVSRENNAEHSYMLSLVATEVAHMHFPWLDSGLVAQFANVHDLPELITGDKATFHLSPDEEATKSQNDAEATSELAPQLPPFLGSLLLRYEAQLEPEARFVRFMDKLLPVAVDILGPGSKVMHEDYQVYTCPQLDEAENKLKERFMRMFPDAELGVLHSARDELAQTFAGTFQAIDTD